MNKEKRSFNAYLLLNHLTVNHPHSSVTFNGLVSDLQKISAYNKPTPAGSELLATIEKMFSPIAAKPSKKKNPDPAPEPMDIIRKYEEMLECALTFMALNPQVFTEECLPEMQKETLWTIRRFLYSRGLAANYKAHSKTKDPLGAMWRKMFPAYNVQILGKKFSVEILGVTSEYPLPQELQHYIKALDLNFDDFRNIKRNEVISLIEELIKRQYNPDDRR